MCKYERLDIAFCHRIYKKDIRRRFAIFFSHTLDSLRLIRATFDNYNARCACKLIKGEIFIVGAINFGIWPRFTCSRAIRSHEIAPRESTNYGKVVN